MRISDITAITHVDKGLTVGTAGDAAPQMEVGTS